MNILVSNDDGINSKALKTLAKTLGEIADVYVVAPDSERSGNSHHFTIKGRMRVEEKQLDGAKIAYSLCGTPADCILVGLQFLIKENIDLVVSGINKGWNTNTDAIYSGTIAAAREGFMQGKKAIAVSLDSFEDRDYTDAAKITKDIVLKYMEDFSVEDYFLNINIPDLPLREIKGYKVCSLEGKIVYNENYSFEEEFGVRYVKLGNAECLLDYDKDNFDIDNVAIRNGYVTISPLYNNHINHKYIEELKTKWEK